eukprot:gene2341-2649_t
MGRKQKRGKAGNAAQYLTRNQAIKKLQLRLSEFRRLCILKGVHPREPKKKVAGVNKTYYHVKDINWKIKVHERRVRKARAKQHESLARRLLANKPGYKLDSLVKERDLDDPLTLVHLFATLPAEQALGISPALTDRKVFVSVKGFYYQVLPPDVDYTVMITFLEFYCTLLQFVLFKLYHNLGLSTIEAAGAGSFESGAFARLSCSAGLTRVCSGRAGAFAAVASVAVAENVSGMLLSRTQLLPASVALLAVTSHRGMFGRAGSAAEEQAAVSTSSPLDVDIGGEGGYFDHDESHAGLADREEISSLFDKWNAALATKNPENVANMYGHDAVLLPTVSNEVRTTRAGIVDYFTNFVKLSPQGKVDQSQIRLLSPGVALHSGVYSFTLQPIEGEAKIVQARFTFLYRKYNGEWKIAEHHSSAMPEAQPAGVAEMFDRWNSALQTGNPEIVADLYAPDGVLLPTVSNQVRTCRQGIIDYFQNFLKLKPYGTINNSVVREVAPGIAINSGVYTFKLTRPETGTTDAVKARYTFIYKKFNDQWFIAEHHSSAMPETAA